MVRGWGVGGKRLGPTYLTKVAASLNKWLQPVSPRVAALTLATDSSHMSCWSRASSLLSLVNAASRSELTARCTKVPPLTCRAVWGGVGAGALLGVGGNRQGCRR